MTKRINTYSLLPFFLLPFSLCPKTAAGQESFAETLIENAVLQFPDKAEISIGLYDNGTVYKYGYVLDEGQVKQSVNSDRIFEIGSITKTFTAALLMDEVEKGAMNLSDGIAKYLPKDIAGEKGFVDKVSLQHLVTHTSGLNGAPVSFVAPIIWAKIFASENPYRYIKIKHYFKYLKKMEFESEPGKKWQYNNAAFALIGHLTAMKNNTSWEILTKKRILEPLGMNQTYFLIEDKEKTGLVAGYNEKENKAGLWQKMELIDPAGVLKSNVDDMMKWLLANLDPAESKLSFLSGTHAELENKINLPDIYGENLMGIGWIHHKSKNGEKIIWHNGGTGGYKSFMGFDKKNNRGVIILANFSGRHPGMQLEDKKNRVDDLGFQIMTLKKNTQ